MKTQCRIILALGGLCAAASIVWFAILPSAPPSILRPEIIEHSQKVETFGVDPETTIGAPRTATAEGLAQDEAVSISEWQELFSALLEKSGDREAATASLISLLDEKYHRWICSKLSALAEVEPVDRYDALAQMESRIHAVSKSVLGQLEVSKAQHVGLLTRSLEAISAEVQYAEMAGTHDARVAMLRLDREREARFASLVAAIGSGPETEAQALSEITPWYESQLRTIVGDEAAD